MFPVESEAKGTLRHEAVYPCAGVRVDAEVCECRDRRGRVEVVKKAGNVEEQNSADVPASNGHLRLVSEERGGVRRGVVFPRAELCGGDEVVIAFVCAKTVSDDLLEKLTRAFEKGDRAIGFGQ